MIGGRGGAIGLVGWSFSPLLSGDKSSTHTNKIEIVFIINIFAQSVVSASEGHAHKNKVGRRMEVFRVDLRETETQPLATATIFTFFVCASAWVRFTISPTAISFSMNNNQRAHSWLGWIHKNQHISSAVTHHTLCNRSAVAPWSSKNKTRTEIKNLVVIILQTSLCLACNSF